MVTIMRPSSLAVNNQPRKRKECAGTSEQISLWFITLFATVGNPHLTRSKPYKIGRKHSGAVSEHRRQLRRNGAKARQQQKQKKLRRYHRLVQSYWAGELEHFPDLPE